MNGLLFIDPPCIYIYNINIQHIYFTYIRSDSNIQVFLIAPLYHYQREIFILMKYLFNTFTYMHMRSTFDGCMPDLLWPMIVYESMHSFSAITPSLVSPHTQINPGLSVWRDQGWRQNYGAKIMAPKECMLS